MDNPFLLCELIRKLSNKFPDETICINPTFTKFPGDRNIEIDYFVHANRRCKAFRHIKDVENYVNELTETLTVNDVLNQGGFDLEVK